MSIVVVVVMVVVVVLAIVMAVVVPLPGTVGSVIDVVVAVVTVVVAGGHGVVAPGGAGFPPGYPGTGVRVPFGHAKRTHHQCVHFGASSLRYAVTAAHAFFCSISMFESPVPASESPTGDWPVSEA